VAAGLTVAEALTAEADPTVADTAIGN